MRRIGRLFGKKQNRNSRKTRTHQAKHWPQFTPRLESLEERRLLAVNVLASDVGAAIDGTQMEFTVPAGSGTHVLGLQVSSPDGSMNPAAPWIESVNGSIAPLYSANNMQGGTDGLLLAELGPGTYTVTIKTEGGTGGLCQLDVFLPGDMNDDGMISSQEYNQACAASVQNDGYWNSFTARYYRSLGIDLNVDQYDAGLDVNMDGRVDGFDMGYMSSNVGLAAIGNVTVDADIDDPAIEAGLEVDSGRSNIDGVTNELAIVGSVSDFSGVDTLTLSIDGGAAQDILGDVAADGTFTLSQERLEELNGSAILEDTEYELTFNAEDSSENTSSHVVTFTLDTVAPDQIDAPDLVDESDHGESNTDDITNEATPTFRMEAQSGDLVQLYITNSEGDLSEFIGEEIAASSVDITDEIGFSNGDWHFTAISIDLAGNASEQSDLLVVTFDRTDPVTPLFDLDAASDTDTVGDQRTSLASVTLVGTTEANVKTVLTVTDASGIPYTVQGVADVDGNFEFTGVPLAWNQNECTIVTTDVAGNTAERTVTITRNNAPSVVEWADKEITVNTRTTESLVSLVDPAMFFDMDFHNGIAEEKLTLSILSNDNEDLLTATLEDGGGLAAGFAQNYQLKIVLKSQIEGDTHIQIEARDETGAVVSTVFTVKVRAGAVDDSTETYENSTRDIDVTDNDPGGPGAVSITLFDATSDHGATITQVYHAGLGRDVLRYDPNGADELNALGLHDELIDTFTYTIEDPYGNESTATVTVLVKGDNDIPTADP
ncbi:MAG: Ig-like domain-containing protein, partial [Planctomycetota bacterium]|nr:Ig-like domain-containing protein [Planctomycetota bacterium]